VRNDLIWVQRQRAQMRREVGVLRFGLARCQALHTALNQHAKGSVTVQHEGQRHEGASVTKPLQVWGSSCSRRPTRGGGDARQLSEAQTPVTSRLSQGDKCRRRKGVRAAEQSGQQGIFFFKRQIYRFIN